ANLSTLQIYINNGDGTFGSPNNYTESCSNNGSELIAADIDGDGKNDIVESCSGSSVITVYTNNGSGGFSTRNNYTASSNPLGLAAADLNGDGSIDLAAADSGTTAVS